ncbi:SDR family oxidoreductase [Balneolaceae bacterium ANBcel3]|nr:SDR family oxidoreductase [Balneolaceae bacterium ANBcel3]
MADTTTLKQKQPLKGKVAVITGGAGVLCSEMAVAMGKAGASIAVIDVGQQAMDSLAEQLSRLDVEHIMIRASVLEKEALADASDRIIERFGKVDILINGAGGNKPEATTTKDRSFFEITDEGMRFVFDLNFMGTFYACQVFGKQFVQQKSGNIINISSMNAFTPLTNIPAYSSAKAAVSNFTQWLAVHMAQNYSPDIRVNAIAPGFLLTEQNRFLLTKQKDGTLTDRGKRIIDHTPAGRFGQPEDLVSTVMWLTAPETKFVHGAVIPVDGGFSAFSGV